MSLGIASRYSPGKYFDYCSSRAQSHIYFNRVETYLQPSGASSSIVNSDDFSYEYEKDALLSAINKYGWSWILAVSVGSEDLYRGDSNVSSLVTQINDVRGMLKSTPSYPTSGIKVGHVDTSNIWTETSTYPLTRACDFVGVDSYPYFQATQNNSISNAGNLFREGIAGVKTAVSKAGSTASVWVAETGWPVNGSTKGLAVAGRENARAYWSDVACSSFDTEVGEGGVNIWWFTLQDWSAYPSFAVVDPEFEVEYDLSC